MLELTVSEKLLYSTMKITTFKAGVSVSTGTGFFMNFARDGEDHWPAIVTNKHVVAGADVITVMCHYADGERPSGQFVACNLRIEPGSCVEHPDPTVDLCAIPTGSLMNKAKSAGKPIYVMALEQSLIPSEEDWQYFDAMEEVTMVGCPNGISDEYNNLPIARRGITASHLSKKYNGKEEFLVDMACFPGSSGSPVFIYDRSGHLNRRTNTYEIGTQRLMFVGILYAGPQISNNGQIILGQQPRVMVAAMMHLGNVIRSTALLAIDAEFRLRAGVISAPQSTVGSVVDANGS